MQTNEHWFDNGSWQPDLLTDSRPQPKEERVITNGHSGEEPVEPDYVPHEVQRASVDFEWPIEHGGEA